MARGRVELRLSALRRSARNEGRMFHFVTTIEGIGLIDVEKVIGLSEVPSKDLYIIFLSAGVGFSVDEKSYREIEAMVVANRGSDGTDKSEKAEVDRGSEEETA